MILQRTREFNVNLDWVYHLIKALLMVLFTFAAFIALVELKRELQIDIFPNHDFPFDDISAYLLGRWYF